MSGGGRADQSLRDAQCSIFFVCIFPLPPPPPTPLQLSALVELIRDVQMMAALQTSIRVRRHLKVNQNRPLTLYHFFVIEVPYHLFFIRRKTWGENRLYRSMSSPINLWWQVEWAFKFTAEGVHDGYWSPRAQCVAVVVHLSYQSIFLSQRNS